MNNIKAIETEYRGYRFRSRLEARWAVFFDALGAKWEYEKEGFDLGDYGWYLPDFWLPDFELWIEVKGQDPTDEESLKLICLVERTKHDAFVFKSIPDSPEDNSWYENFTVQVEGHYWSRSLKVADRLPLAVQWDGYIGVKNQYHFLCPVCKDEYVHFENPRLEQSDDYTAWEFGRGSAARLPMWCEQGHSWTLRFGFHKGFTFMALEDVYSEVDNPGLVLAANNTAIFCEALRQARSARFEHGEKPTICYKTESVA